jgi:hypothetical protein
MRELMYYVDSKDRIVIETQRLTSHPPGNSAQRKKALRSGWQPTWVTSEKRFVESVGPISTQEGCDIYNENEHVAEMGRIFAQQTVQEINFQNENFEISPFVPTPVFVGHQILCWVCDEKFSTATHEGHPICNDCLDHFLHTSSEKLTDGCGPVPDDCPSDRGNMTEEEKQECRLDQQDDADREERVNFHQKVAKATTYGPAGFGAPDDGE